MYRFRLKPLLPDMLIALDDQYLKIIRINFEALASRAMPGEPHISCSAETCRSAKADRHEI